jgi:pimeloyl-ACP methyl ester carboxylesterase
MRIGILLTLLMMLSLAVGCGSGQPYVTEPRLEKGLVIVLSGIEGRGPWNEEICRGLDEGGVDLAIENYPWAVPGMWWYNLRDEEHHYRQAEAVARRVAEYKVDYPDRPVFLVGQSGGGAIAVWAAERLPRNTLEGVILLAAALSPTTDLQRTVAASRRGVVNFHSRGDWLILGLGTRMAGTMDGERSDSAGMVGFAVPPGSLAADAYREVYQIPWKPEMVGSGHMGGHLSSSARWFVRDFMAPLVVTPRWNAGLIEEVGEGEFLAGRPGR